MTQEGGHPDPAVDRSGEDLGPYQLVRLIGHGGMGVVYEARDSRLGRSVALKILLPEVVKDAERRARFEREAKALAALKHPGIVTIHSFETIGEDTFFTMELVEGRTLGEVMRDEGAMSVARILEIGVPVADALAGAHKRGIAHRDVKPDNIIIGPRGEVTVLDFGLAKLVGPVVETQDHLGVTASMDATVEGRIIGTIHYMAPEQAQGGETNPTTDVFSLGVILYEMATGTTPFPGETTVSKLSSIIKDEPRPIIEFNKALPVELERLIRRCLAKDPDRRWQNAVDVRNELELLRDELANPTERSEGRDPRQPGSSGRFFVATTILVIVGLICGFLMGIFMMDLGRDAELIRAADSAGVLPEHCVSVTGPAGHEIIEAEIDPGATRLAMVTRSQLTEEQSELDYIPGDRRFLHLRDLDAFETRMVPDSQRIASGEFSPEGSSYIFVKLPSESNLPAKIMRLSLDTGLPPAQIGTIPFSMLGYDPQMDSSRGFVWLEDARLAFITEKPYQVVTVNAETGAEIARVDIGFDDNVQANTIFAPLDATRFLVGTNYYDDRGFIQDVMWVDSETGATGVLIEGSPVAEVIPGNQVLFTRGATLYQADYDPDARSVTGEAAPVFTDLRTQNSWSSGDFDVAADGTVIHLPGGMQGGVRTLWTIEEDGTTSGIDVQERAYEERLAVSSDGKRLVITHTNDNNAMWDLWSGTTDPPRLRRLVSFPDLDIHYPVLSQDGERILARMTTTQPRRRVDLVVMPGDGREDPRTLVTESSGELYPYDIHPAGGRVLYGQYDPMAESGALYDLRIDEDAEPRMLVDGVGRTSNARWSPDGRLLAYVDDGSGFPEAHVAVDGPDGLEATVTASDGLAEQVSWSLGPGEMLRLHYFSNGLELTRTVVLEGSRIVLGPITRTGRVLGDDTTNFTLDQQGRIYSIRKGANEVPASRVEVISGRFRPEV